MRITCTVDTDVDSKTHSDRHDNVRKIKVRYNPENKRHCIGLIHFFACPNLHGISEDINFDRDS